MGLDTPGVIVEPVKFGGSLGSVHAVPGLRVRLRVFVSGRESSLVARRVCVACRHVKSKAGGFPLTMSTVQQLRGL